MNDPSSDKIPTEFAPAERAPASLIFEQVQEILSAERLDRLFGGVFDAVLILNEHRQIVFSNRAFLQLVNASKAEEVYGLRPGEALNCIHSASSPGGCGTTEFCRECGAIKAIITAQAGTSNIQECRITKFEDGEALDLQIHAEPIEVAGRQYTIVAARDISSDKRRRVLERIFFHDVINTAYTAQSASELLNEEDKKEGEKFRDIVRRLTKKLVDQIQSQSDLSSAENGELIVNWGTFDANDLLFELAEAYRYNKIAKDKVLSVNYDNNSHLLLSDRTLLERVIENLTKNALEASEPGCRIVLRVVSQGDRIVFSVHNPGCMSTEVQHQIFQRSFSTKGQGRGIGTYSAKLISEHYLQGKVYFTSNDSLGTTFFAEFPLKPEIKSGDLQTQIS